MPSSDRATARRVSRSSHPPSAAAVTKSPSVELNTVTVPAVFASGVTRGVVTGGPIGRVSEPPPQATREAVRVAERIAGIFDITHPLIPYTLNIHDTY